MQMNIYNLWKSDQNVPVCCWKFTRQRLKSPTWEKPCCRARPAGSWSYWMRDPSTLGCVVWQCLAGCVTMSCRWCAGQWGGSETTGLCWDSLLGLRWDKGKTKRTKKKHANRFRGWDVIHLNIERCQYVKQGYRRTGPRTGSGRGKDIVFSCNDSPLNAKIQHNWWPEDLITHRSACYSLVWWNWPINTTLQQSTTS